MKQAARWIGLAIWCLASAARADLSGDVEQILKDRQLDKVVAGIEIIHLGKTQADSKVVYEHASHSPLMPASNLKLATTSAALDHFGQNFKFRTLLLQHGDDLALIGDGDPSFGDAEYLRRVGWTPTTVFENWTNQLKKLNVKSIRNLSVDDSVFDTQFLNPDWPLSQMNHSYVAEVSGLNFDANCVTFILQPTTPGARVQFSLVPNTAYVIVDNDCRTGKNEVQLGRKPDSNEMILKGEAPSSAPSSIEQTIHDPPMYAATVLSETIVGDGIPLTGQIKRDRTAHQLATESPGNWKTIGVHETPLAVVLARANKDSINFYAESLCKRLGHDMAHAPGSWTNGTTAVGDFLKKTGVPETEFHLVDGCGLSRLDHISPHALARVLTYDYFSPNHDALVNSLAIAGVDGTLEERFRGSDLRRRVFAKSGFIEGVSCLSGFVKTRDDRWYAFSIMMNRVAPAVGKAAQEKIIRAIDTHAATTAAAR